MSWAIFMQEVDKYHERQKKLKRIVEIVASHPEWLEQDAELKQLVEEFIVQGI